MKKLLFAICLISSFSLEAATPLPLEQFLYKGQAFPFYNDASDSEQQKLIQVVRNARLAENMAFVATTSLRLRSDIRVGFESCGTANAFFSQQRSMIVICSEFIELIAKVAARDKDFAMKLDKPRFVSLINGVIWGVYFHELAHAIISINRVSITGREEDVADQFTVWNAINFVGLRNQPVIAPTIWFYRQLAKNREVSSMSQDALKHFLANEHSLDEQRIYNLACWSFGAGPEIFNQTAQFAGLPEDRAKRCPSEYAGMNDGIRSRFKKYFKLVRN